MITTISFTFSRSSGDNDYFITFNQVPLAAIWSPHPLSTRWPFSKTLDCLID